MTASEFRIIRRFNGINQTQMGERIDRTRHTIARFEKEDSIPHVLTKALSEIVGFNLNVPSKLKECLRTIPRKYFLAECPCGFLGITKKNSEELDKWINSINAEGEENQWPYKPAFISEFDMNIFPIIG